MKKGFFRRYFMYKLCELRGTAIAMAIVNFFSVTFVAIVVYYAQLRMMAEVDNEYSSGGWEAILFSELSAAVILLALAAGAGMVAMTAVKNFAVWNKRELTDVIGCLPLTYRQRFWGDFLSGISAHLISFVPLSVLGAFFAAAAQYEVDRKMALIDTSVLNSVIPLIPTYLSLVLLLLVGYLGIYALACFVVSCCGRTGSAVSYTLSAMIFPPCVAVTYCICIFRNATGVRIGQTIGKAVSAIPGLGVWTGAWVRMFSSFEVSPDFNETLRGLWHLTDEPEYLIAAVLTIAALTAGAYFLGKHRKAERTGRDLVFGGAYYVISSLTVVAFTGIFLAFTDDLSKIKPLNVLFAVLCAFIPYTCIELVHKRSLKKFWLAAARFAVLFAACFGFGVLGRNTGGFGAEKYVPSVSSIEEIRLSGHEATGLYFGALRYASDEAISVLTGEHRRIVDNIDDGVGTGSDLVITYVLKNGRQVKRFYSTPRSTPAAFVKVYENILGLEPTDSSALGVVSTRKYDEIRIRFSKIHSSEEGESRIARGREEAFFDVLKRDLINSPRPSEYNREVVRVSITYTYAGSEEYDTYVVFDTYTDTLAFLSDPANIDETYEDKPRSYYIMWRDADVALTGRVEYLELNNIYADDKNAKQLLSYIKKYDEIPEGERSNAVRVSPDNGASMYVAKSDEMAVLAEMLKIARARL